MKPYLTEKIEKFIREYEKNTYTKWGKPLLGFADVKKVEELKSLIPSHENPRDALAKATIVIAYYIPFLPELADTNMVGEMASPQWARAYEETNAMFAPLNDFLIRTLEEKGYHGAVSPEAGSFDRSTLMSRWSHRHIAYLAGLGTFGLNNMLITKNGCCGRFHTLITDLDVAPDEPMREEQCIFKRMEKCGSCVKHCPSGALTRTGFKRQVCYELCRKNAAIHNRYGNSYASVPGGKIEESGSEVCGKCVTGMPCAFMGIGATLDY